LIELTNESLILNAQYEKSIVYDYGMTTVTLVILLLIVMPM